MSTDKARIEFRLRITAACKLTDAETEAMFAESADEIERLRAELAKGNVTRKRPPRLSDEEHVKRRDAYYEEFRP